MRCCCWVMVWRVLVCVWTVIVSWFVAPLCYIWAPQHLAWLYPHAAPSVKPGVVHLHLLPPFTATPAPEDKAASPTPLPAAFAALSESPLCSRVLSWLPLAFLVVSKLYHGDGAQHPFGTLRPGTLLCPLVMFLWYSLLDYGTGKNSAQNAEF